MPRLHRLSTHYGCYQVISSYICLFHHIISAKFRQKGSRCAGWTVGRCDGWTSWLASRRKNGCKVRGGQIVFFAKDKKRRKCQTNVKNRYSEQRGNVRQTRTVVLPWLMTCDGRVGGGGGRSSLHCSGIICIPPLYSSLSTSWQDSYFTRNWAFHIH